MFLTRLKNSKTLWTAISGIVAAIAAYSQGKMDVTGLVEVIWLAATAVFIRDGVEKNGSTRPQ